MWGELPALGIGRAELDRVSAVISRLGGMVAGFATARPFGLPPSFLRGHIDRAAAEVSAARAALTEAAPQAESFGPWYRERTIGRLAGIAMITPRYPWTRSPDPRAFLAKALFQCQQDVLDDLVDRAVYPFPRASALYSLCAAATVRDVPRERLAADLAAHLLPEHLGLAGILSRVTCTLHAILRDSPNAAAIIPELARVGEGLALSQAGMSFLRTATWDPPSFRGIGEALPAPDPDLSWDERLAIHMTWTLSLALIDLAFAEDPIPRADLEATERAWYNLNGVITYLDHAGGIEEDRRAGIANAALLTLRRSEIMGASGLASWEPAISDGDLSRLLAHTAEFQRRALLAMDGRVGAGLYGFLGVMIPTTLLAGWAGRRDALVTEYLRRIAPHVRASLHRPDHHSTTYSQNPSPFRMQRVFTTLPGNPRNRRTPS